MSSALTYESLFIRRATSPQAQWRLFCFPFAGAGASIYGAWPELLPPEIEVIAIQLPGREDRVFEQPFSRLRPLVRTVAQAIRPYLHTPFAFFGYCYGALISYEIIKELEHRFQASPTHLFVASQPAPHLPYKHPQIHQLPPEQFQQGLQEIEGTTEEILQNEDMMQLLLPALRADFALHELYAYEPHDPLNCAVTALGGMQDSRVSEEELEAWQEHTKGLFSVRLFEGGHFFVNPVIEDVLSVIASALL